MASTPPLSHCVAVVTGSSRGAGRGIAIELGAAGATVYVTGRSRRGQPAPGYEKLMAAAGMAQLPGSIEDTAEAVTQAGGRGIAVPCDHTQADQVAALFDRVQREQGRLDLLVNNAWGGHQDFEGLSQAPFWQRPVERWDPLFNRGVRNHLLASHQAAPIFVRQGRGLIVTTTFWDRGRFMAGDLLYDLAKSTMTRLAFGMAQELKAHGVASVAVSPGWMRTEFVLACHFTDEARWRDKPELAGTETPRYLGRAVAALAADPQVLRKTGRALRVADLAREYGFTDVDGRWVPPFELADTSA